MKTVYFIRHGEAIHNPDVDKYGKDILTNEKYFDANLTDIGLSQCDLIKSEVLKLKPDIVFTSPLTRTLQTANHLFSNTNINIVGLEMIRERYGMRPCDQRSGLTDLQERFQNIDFETYCHPGKKDPLWTKRRETEQEIGMRIKKFLKWVKERPEKKIVIVTHQGFIIRLWNILGINNPDPRNCEIRKLELKN